MNVGVKRFRVLHAGPTLPETCVYFPEAFHYLMCNAGGGSLVSVVHPVLTLTARWKKLLSALPSIPRGWENNRLRIQCPGGPPLTLLDPDLCLGTPLPPIRRSYPLRFLTGAFNHVQGCTVRELPSWEAFCFPISNINVELFILLHLTFKCN